MDAEEKSFLALARGGEKARGRKRKIIDVLSSHGYLTLSNLSRLTGIPIATLHGYVGHLTDAGVVRSERVGVKRFLSLGVHSVGGRSPEATTSVQISPQNISNIVLYLESMRKDWREIAVRVGNQQYSFSEYLPFFVTTRLYPLVIGPIDTLEVVTRIAKRLQKENTGYEVDRMAGVELSMIDPALGEKFKDLVTNEKALKAVKNVAREFVSKRRFTGPSLNSLKRILDEEN
ncbi:MAG: helix-turn-helix transcriptional regulator [Thaumarchaeota archaeon]|nr:helix-turn-helix transcriptional regulator [Nitrososphaerota archaeon]